MYFPGVDLLREGTEFDAALPEVVEHGDQVAQAAAQAVEFPDEERVAVLQCLEATEQGWAQPTPSTLRKWLTNICHWHIFFYANGGRNPDVPESRRSHL
jgi:hypothetical protein